MEDYNRLDREAAKYLAELMTEWNHPQIRTLDPLGREIIGQVLADAVGRHYPKRPSTPDSEAISGKMREIGYAELGPLLDEGQVAEVVEFFQVRPCYNHHYQAGIEEDGEVKPFTEAAEEFHFGSYSQEDILGAPHLIEAFLRDDILDAVEDFLGARPMLFSVNSFWSFPQDTPPSYGQDFHRDISHPKFCVLFIYLTEATDKTGAHQYIRFTHSLPFLQTYLDSQEELKPVRHFFELPMDGLGFSDLYEDYFSELIETIRGPAGSAILEDTYGLHRGLPPREHPRLMAWARYSLFPYPPKIKKMPRDFLGVRYPDDERRQYVLRGLIE